MTDQWTPTTTDIRGIIAWRHAAYRDRLTVETFDRWLAEVRATALEEAADDYERESGTSNGAIPWLRDRAARIREERNADPV